MSNETVYVPENTPALLAIIEQAPNPPPVPPVIAHDTLRSRLRRHVFYARADLFFGMDREGYSQKDVDELGLGQAIFDLLSCGIDAKSVPTEPT